jgi:hypothetical protein
MDQSEEYHEAKRKVTKLKAFYQHLAFYIFINVVLIAINLIISPGTLWFYWVTIFWGIAVIWQAYDVFGNEKVLGKDWEEKKIQKYLEKKK